MEEDETFDIVFHPVSNCYVEDVQHIFNEAYRVLKRGGIFLAGLNNEINYIVDEEEKEIVWEMPFNLLNCQIKLDFSSNSEKLGRVIEIVLMVIHRLPSVQIFPLHL